MKTAILGFGVVGSGTYEILEKNGYKVGKVLDIRPHAELGDILTSDFDDILNDPEIGVVAEAIGGLEPAHTFVVKALKAGKHVVSSNKHLICSYYDELHALAREHGVAIRFSASAGGGIPWLHNLSRVASVDKISRVYGIMNGTTNFILDAMISESKDFSEALAEAQRLGYAESDPSADIDGFDTARKIAISASIAFGDAEEDDVFILSLRNIKKIDIEYIESRFNKTVRYIGEAYIDENGAYLTVSPEIISKQSVFSAVKKNNNMISLIGESVGELSFFGQGAGKYPTGCAVAGDVIDILNGDITVLPPQKKLKINSSLKKKYYIRTSSDFPCDLTESIEVIGSEKFIITKELEISEIKKIKDELLFEKGVSFIAGIER